MVWPPSAAKAVASCLLTAGLWDKQSKEPRPLTWGVVRAAKDSNPQIRSPVLCVDLVGSDGSGLLTLDGSSIQTGPVGSSG
jgi:hypothetical protein